MEKMQYASRNSFRLTINFYLSHYIFDGIEDIFATIIGAYKPTIRATKNDVVRHFIAFLLVVKFRFFSVSRSLILIC